MTKSKKTSQTRQKFDLGMEQKITIYKYNIFLRGDIQNYHPANWPIRLLEINMVCNNTSSQMLLDHCYMHLVCCCSVAFRSEEEVSWRSGTPWFFFCPALDMPLGGFGRKTTTLVKDYACLIPTKFHQNQSSGTGEEAENVKFYRRKDAARFDKSSLEPLAQVGYKETTFWYLDL